MSSALYVHEYAGGDAWKSCKRRMKRVKKTGKHEEGKYHKEPNIFSFCFHLADIGDVNDRPVSVDQSRRKLQHSRDGTPVTYCAKLLPLYLLLCHHKVFHLQ